MISGSIHCRFLGQLMSFDQTMVGPQSPLSDWSNPFMTDPWMGPWPIPTIDTLIPLPFPTINRGARTMDVIVWVLGFGVLGFSV